MFAPPLCSSLNNIIDYQNIRRTILTWQETLGRESKYFGVAVLISSLFWIALATIIEHNIIAQEYLYSRERNGFVLTIAILFIIRLSTWMSNEEDICEDRKWKAETSLAQRYNLEDPIIVGEAKDIGGEQRAEQLDWARGDAKNWMTLISN
jgi:hypothetical protein